MKLVLIGIPGAGKSTQGNLLSSQLRIPYLSTGHIFRQIAKEKSPLGRYVKETMRSGLLIPDERTIPIVSEYLSRDEYRRGYILDGFPRTVGQARKFREGVNKVIYIYIPDKEALWRLAYRNETTRADDTVEAIRKRIEVFHNSTRPVIDYYQRSGKLTQIDGTKSVEEVNKETLKSLGKNVVADKIKQWRLKKKIILAIVGLPGSGKTEAAKHFRSRGISVVGFGDIVNKRIDSAGLIHSPENHKKMIKELRRKHGMEALAKLSIKPIISALAKKMVLVIDGVRSFQEKEYLSKKIAGAKIVLISLCCDKNIRYARIKERKERNNLFGEERDRNEIEVTGLGETFALADYFIENNGSVEDFVYKLDRLYHTIYFG